MKNCWPRTGRAVGTLFAAETSGDLGAVAGWPPGPRKTPTRNMFAWLSRIPEIPFQAGIIDLPPQNRPPSGPLYPSAAAQPLIVPVTVGKTTFAGLPSDDRWIATGNNPPPPP